MHVRPEEQRQVAQWQRITIYRYTLPPPYEATEHLFEELPLSTYPSGTRWGAYGRRYPQAHASRKDTPLARAPAIPGG